MRAPPNLWKVMHLRTNVYQSCKKLTKQLWVNTLYYNDYSILMYQIIMKICINICWNLLAPKCWHLGGKKNHVVIMMPHPKISLSKQKWQEMCIFTLNRNWSIILYAIII